MSLLKKILFNKLFIYLLSRYGTYALQFFISMVIAAKLGPYYLGVYGFFTLVINYFAQLNFGVANSLNVLIVHNKVNPELTNRYISNSFFIYTIISFVVVLLFLLTFVFELPLTSKFTISKLHLFLLALIAIEQYFSFLCTTLLRVYNKVLSLAIAQSSLVILNTLFVLFFKDEKLIYALLISQSLSFFSYIFIAYYKGLLPKFRSVFQFDIQYIKQILHKGLYLFIYNSGFYFILISIRTLISKNYLLEEFGYFNFSYTLAHAVLLLIDSFSTIIFPKIIDLLSSTDYSKVQKHLSTIRVSFISTAHFLVYIAIIVFPLIVKILPQYSVALPTMGLISLSILMNTNSYGCTSFLIAQNCEKRAAFISIIALLVNVIIGNILIRVFKVEFSYVIFSVMITYLIFSLLSVIESKKIMGVISLKEVLKDFFPYRLLIPYVMAIIAVILNRYILLFLPLCTYIILNYSDLRKLYGLVIKVVNKPNIIDL